MKQKKPFYSIGIIFKDEIRCLERCLKSLQPLRDAVPCEVVMADTGSTDGSREVAEEYADILFDFPWCDDFSAARNAVMDRCGGEWYFSIDADEWLAEDISELIQYAHVKKLPRDFAGLTIRNYKTTELEKSKHYVDFTATRLARLSTGIRYTGCIHEAWLASDGGTLMISILGNTMLYHDGYAYFSDEQALAKHDRNMALLSKKLEADPQDLQTLVECMDSAKHLDAESSEYARKAVEGIYQKWPNWQKFGPVVFRDAVSIAKLYKLPELKEWIGWAEEHYPDSIFTRVDVYYYAMVDCWDENDYAGCVRWGELDRQGLSAYQAGKFDINEPIRGVLEYSSPHWERRLLILLSESYLNCNQPEKAFATFQDIKGGELDETEQVEACANMLLRLHRTAQLDTPALAADFWEAIGQPTPGKEDAEKRRRAFLKVASRCFTRKYQLEEETKAGFLHHSYTVFTGLRDRCGLKLAAEILESDDPAFQAVRLYEVEDWKEFPVQALAHALKCGIGFPQPQRPLGLENMDYLAEQLGWLTEELPQLFLQNLEGDFDATLQKLIWMRGMAIIVVRGFPWSETDDAARGLAIARGFARVEGAYLHRCYTAEMLCEENILLIPPLHRFGWYCARAFETLGAGDAAGYVRLLRVGLEGCKDMKPMVEFLQKHTPELNAAEPADELRILADQIRTTLSRFAPDDPMVAALKQSEAYQRVAYLIDGFEVPVVGRQLQ